MGSRFEVWTHPATGVFERRILRLPVVSASVSMKNTQAEGARLVLPSRYPYINLILRRDVNNPANNVRSLIRVFDDDAPSTAVPIAEFVPVHIPDAIDPANNTTVTCMGVLKSFTWDSIVWAFDHPTWLWPDWIWGGRNILANPGFEETRTIGARYEADGDATGGTWVITVDGDDANIAIPATAASIKVALEALDPSYRVNVTGAGTVGSPWNIEFIVPHAPMVSFDTSGTTGGVVRAVVVSAGQLLPVAWEPSRHPVTNQQHGFYSFFGLDDTVVDSGVYSLRFNGTDVGIFDYPGVNQYPEVQPGGIYQVAGRYRAASTADRLRFVLRDMTEGIPSEFPDPLEFFPPSANTWLTATLGQLNVPADIDQIIYRFAYVGGGDANNIWVDNFELREGLAPATCGEILRLLKEDATTNHAGDVPSRVSLAQIVLGFSDTLDSNGDAWDRLLSFTVVHGQRFWQVLEALHETFGYEFSLDWNGTNWTLNGYNPGQRGEQDPELVPGIVVGINAVTGGPLAYDALTGNAILAEGAQRLWSRSEDPTAITAAGRIETYVPMGDVLDQATLDAAAAAQVAELLKQGLSVALTISAGAAPYLGTGGPDGIPIGSMTRITVPGHLTQYPVRLDSVELNWPQGASSLPVRTGHFSSEVFNDEEGTREMVRRIAERHASTPPPKPEAKKELPGLGGAGTHAPTVTIASYDSPQRDQDQADFICPAGDAWATINEAMNKMIPDPIFSRGWIHFAQGTYEIDVSNGETIDFAGCLVTGSGGGLLGEGTVFYITGSPASARPFLFEGEYTTFRDFSIIDDSDYSRSVTGIAAGEFCTIDGVSGWVSGHFIELTGSYSTITRCTVFFGGFGGDAGPNHCLLISQAREGIRVHANSWFGIDGFGIFAFQGTGGTEANVIDGNAFLECEFGGIYLGVTGSGFPVSAGTGQSKWSWTITGNAIESCAAEWASTPTRHAAIYLEHAPGVAVTGNAITNSLGHGIVVDSTGTGSVIDPWIGGPGGSVISGNTITRTSGYVVWFRNSDTEIKYYPVTVVGNHFGSDGNDAFRQVRLERMRDVSIQANLFGGCGIFVDECTQISILANKFVGLVAGVDGSSPSKTGIIELDDSHHCTVKSNDFQCAEGQAEAMPRACVYLLNGSDWNRIRDNDYQGISALDVQTQPVLDYGVWFAASAGTNNRAVGNDFHLVGTASIQDDAGGNVVAWPGGGNDNW